MYLLSLNLFFDPLPTLPPQAFKEKKTLHVFLKDLGLPPPYTFSMFAPCVYDINRGHVCPDIGKGRRENVNVCPNIGNFLLLWQFFYTYKTKERT